MSKNEYSKCDDISDVIGIRKSDKLLQVGVDFKFMKKYVKELTIVNTPEEVGYQNTYDKIFLCYPNVDEDLIAKLSCICKGTITIFEEDDDKRKELTRIIETKWYPAQSWDMTSNVGKCLVTDSRGPKKNWEV